MSVRNINSFKCAKSANDMMANVMVNAKKNMLINLIEEIEPFINDMIDIRDTFFAIRREDKEYAEKLWKYLIGMENGKYVMRYRMDMNSYFGVRFNSADFYTNVVITPMGLAIFFNPITHGNTDDWESKKYKGNNAKSYIMENNFSEDILDKYINSVKGLLEWFPQYSQKFFDLVENPKF